MNKKVFSLILAVIMVLSMLPMAAQAENGTAHTHVWDTGWTSSGDGTAHWHKCTAENCPITDYSAEPESGYTACSLTWVDGGYSNGTLVGHYQQCSVCGYKSATTDHTITYVPRTDGFPQHGHWKYCAVCNKTFTGVIFGHNLSGYTDIGSQHQRICSDCGYAENEDHKIYNDGNSATSNDNGTHSGTCTICNLSVTVDCKWATVKKSDASGHWQECYYCRYTTPVEAHTEFTYNYAGYNSYMNAHIHHTYCKSCGYTIKQAVKCTSGAWTAEEGNHVCRCIYCNALMASHAPTFPEDSSLYKVNEDGTHTAACAGCNTFTLTAEHDFGDTGICVCGEATSHTVTVTADENGTASANKQTAEVEETVTLTATPNSGYQFKEWEVFPYFITISENQFTMPNAPVSVKAVFEKIPDPGTVTLSSDAPTYGDTVSLRYTPKDSNDTKTITSFSCYTADDDTTPLFTGTDSTNLIFAINQAFMGQEFYVVAAMSDSTKLTSPRYTAQKADLTVTTSPTIQEKIYDGTPTAKVLNKGDLFGINENVTFEVTAAFRDENAGENKTVDLRYTLPDNYDACYSIPTGVTTTGTIRPQPVSATVTVTPDSYTYTGDAITPTAVVVSDGSTSLSPDEYTVEYSNNTNVGTATVSIKAKTGSNYAVTGSGTFKITQASLDGAAVTLLQDSVVYNGSAQTPTPTVIVNGRTLVQGADYTLDYLNNTNAGTATVKITGTGNYEGTTSKTFTIAKATPAYTVPNDLTAKYGQTLADVTLPEGWSWMDSSQSVGETGTQTHKATFTPDDTANYNAAEDINVMVQVGKADGPAAPTVTGSYAVGANDRETFTYTVDPIAGAEYSKDGATWQASNVFEGIDPASTPTFYARIKATDTHNVGAPGSVGPITFTKLDRTDIPPLNVTVTGEPGSRSVTIAAVDGTEYSFDGGNTWGSINSTDNVTSPITVMIRYAATATHNASTPAQMTIDPTKQEQAALTIAAVGDKTYGDQPFDLSVTGGSGDGAVSFESLNPDILSISGNTATIKKAGTVTITATKAAHGSYNEASASLTLTVARKAVTIKADDKNLVKGSTPIFTCTVPALVPGDTFSNPQYTTTAPSGYNTAGQYTIRVTGTLSNEDSYDVTYEPGTLNITEPLYTLTVNGGTGAAGTGQYAQGDVVSIRAGTKSGYTFSGWTSSGGGSFADDKSAATTFTMPENDVTLTAVFEEDAPAPGHTHTWASVWSNNATHHWHECTAPDCAVTDNSGKDGYGLHSDGDADGLCDTCKYLLNVPKVVTQIKQDEITEVPDGLKNTEFDTVPKIVAELSRVLTQNTGYAAGNIATFDVTLQFSLDGGQTWIDATETNFPKDGITVTLPYPTGTGRSTHDFIVTHMFTVTSAKLGTTAGDTEQPPVTELDGGIQVTLKGLSPVGIAWKAVDPTDSDTDTPDNPNTGVDVPHTGDNSNMGLWLGLLALCAAGFAVVAVVSRKRRKSK